MDVADQVGDCEDFANLKSGSCCRWVAVLGTAPDCRARLRGWPHPVRTSEGDLILDNRTSRIKDWWRTPYRYFARQAPGNGRKWERIGGAVAVVARTAGGVRVLFERSRPG